MCPLLQGCDAGALLRHLQLLLLLPVLRETEGLWAMEARRNSTPMIASSGYVAVVDEGLCAGCGQCADVCQFAAISVDGVALIDASACMGCGVCIAHCPQEAIELVRSAAKGEPLEIQKLSIS